MNSYIKLFSRLAKEEVNTLINIQNLQELGFFLTDFERLHNEGYIFLEKSIMKGKDLFHVKLAPKGFSSLEDYLDRKRQEEKNEVLLDATVIIALAGALGVFVNIWNLILGSNNNIWKGLGLAVIGVIMAILVGTLGAKTFSLLQGKRDKKG